MRKFEHHLAPLHSVVGKVDLAHAAVAELLYDRVVIDLITRLQGHSVLL